MIEAPYKLPASWEWVRLSEIVQELESGGRPKGGVRGIKSGIPSIGGEHLSNEGGFDFHSIRFVPLSFAKSMRKGRVKIDDILIVKDGATTGKTSFVGEDFLYPMAVLNEHVFRLRVYPDVAEQRYVFHYLRSPLGQKMIADSFRGSAQGGINQGFTEFVTVPVAPLREQRRITERLRLVFNRIASAKRGLLSSPPLLHRLRQLILAKAFRGELTERDPNDEPAEKLLERVRQERRKKWEESLRARGKDPRKHKYEEADVFDTEEEADVFDTEELPILPYTWAWTTIGAIASFIGSGITPLGGQNVYVSKGIPFIRSQNVYPSGIHLEDIVYIAPEMHAEMKRTHVRPDDVLLNITGASIGRSTYVPPCFGEANVNQHVCILRTGWWMIPSYLSNFLNSPLGQDQIFATESGVTREGLNYGQIRKMKIPFAPLNEQKRVTQRIAEMFARASTAERAVHDGLKQADVFEQSILNRAFRGELVPQDPSDEPASVLLERIRVQRAATKKKGKFQTQLELVVPAETSSQA